MTETGLLVAVFRDSDLHSDCTNGGLTSKHDRFILLGISGPFEPHDDAPALRLSSKSSGHVYARPLDEPDSGNVGWMFGGNFVYTSDSRFPEYPVPVHDRQESVETYRQLSI